MNRKILIAFGIVGALVFGAAATDANAVCALAKQFNLAFGAGERFFVFPADANKAIAGGVLKGRWWQAGNRANGNEGSGTATPCNEPTYLIDDGSGGASTFFGFMAGDFGQGVCEGAGCPTADLIALFQTLSTDGSKAYYAAGKAPGSDSWDFGGGAAIDWTFVEVPRPRVTSSARGGSVVTIGAAFDAPAGARGEAGGYAPESILTGYQIVTFEGTGDPGRAANLWANLGAVLPVSSSGASVGGVAVTCSGTANDVFVATRPVFDNGQYSGDYVSASTRIECDPTLADPRFKNIDKSKSGRGATVRQN